MIAVIAECTHDCVVWAPSTHGGRADTSFDARCQDAVPPCRAASRPRTTAPPQDHRDKPRVTTSTGGKGYYSDLDTSCSVGLWLYLIGFDITYGSLFAKLWSVYRRLPTATDGYRRLQTPSSPQLAAAAAAKSAENDRP